MKILYNQVLFIILGLTPVFGLCQTGTGLENSLGLTEGNLRFGLGVQNLDVSETLDYKGSPFLYDEPNKGVVIFNNGNVSDEFFINLDLVSEQIYVYADSKIKTLPFEYIQSLRFSRAEDTLLLKKVNIDDENFFAEVLITDQYDIIKLTKAKTVKPYYNKALDQGEKRITIKKKTAFYLLKNNNLIKLPKHSKKIKNDLNFPANLRRYAKKNKSVLKNASDVFKYFEGFFKTLN